MMHCNLLVMLPMAKYIYIPPENVHLTCSSPTQGVYYICPATMFYFRCEVIKCIYLKWLVSGSEEYTVFPYSMPSDLVLQDPLNILIHTVSAGAVETDTNFTSYLWFNSSLYLSDEIESDIEITCNGRQHSESIMLKSPGIISNIHFIENE